MEHTDISVLRDLLTWRRSGHTALLATVVRTWGSSPRQPGAMMALCEDGKIVGSVSGGCIEDDLIARYSGVNAASCIKSGVPELVCYGVTADEAHRFGLPCGGTLELILEFNPDIVQLETALNRLRAGNLIQRRLSLVDGSVELFDVAAPADVKLYNATLSVTLGPAYRMLLIGGGSLSQYLATMALFSGFDVTICDPRQEYLDACSVPGVKVTSEMPDDAVISFKADRRSCIVALTHDPKLDDLALLEALNGPAFYVGAIGSRRNSAQRRERLATHFGMSEISLARLHSPVGIYIDSKTPPEIAVSVMAEIIAVKNAVCLPVMAQINHAKTSLQAA